MRRMRLTQESSRSEQTPDRQRPTLTRFTTLKALLKLRLLSAFFLDPRGYDVNDDVAFERHK